jgi:hypothetical protein
MAQQNGEQTPAEKFTAYNPYAAELADLIQDGEMHDVALGLLAVAYELKQLNGAVRFGNQGRSK